VRDDAPISYPQFQEWRSSGAFEDLAALMPSRLDLVGGEAAERVNVAQVSDNFFTVLGVQAALGRVFTTGDRTASETPAVISDALWRRRFGGDPAIVGRRMTAGDLQVVVVGVMPRRFERWRLEAHIWLPIERAASASLLSARGYLLCTPIGRLPKDGSTAMAQGKLEAADRETTRRIEAQSPGNGYRSGVRLVRLRDDVVPAKVDRLVIVLFVAVALTWLVVCANISTLLLSRGARRSTELAVRLAIGADRARLIRQLLVESAVLAVPAGAVGALAGAWTVRWFVAAAPPGLFDLSPVRFDVPIVAFVVGLTAASAVVFGVLPALGVSKVTLQSAVHGRRGSSTRRLSNALIVAEIATALVVLVGASLVVKSLIRMQQVQLGFEPGQVVTFRVNLPAAKYGATGSIEGAPFVQAQRELLDRLGSLPGVEGVTFGDGIFVPNVDGRTSILFEDGRRLLNGNPKDRPLAPGLHIIGPGYFRVHGARLAAGREFTTRDGFNAPRVVVINETMARMHWAGQTPIGRRVNFGRARARGGSPDEPWAEVIGVAADIRHGGIEMPSKPEIYRAALQYPRPEFEMMIRTSVQPERVAASAREQIRAFDPEVPVFATRFLDDVVAGATATTRYSSVLLSLFAAITAVLCGFGVFSVLAYGVASQQRDLGIRIALGAAPGRMVFNVMSDAARLLFLGVAAGLITVIFTMRLAAGLLYEVSPRDPGVMMGAVVAIAVSALVAAWVPARRAARTDPMAALKSE
jgi:putative ABC transport system permease protein